MKLILRTIAVIVLVLGIHALVGCSTPRKVIAPSFVAVRANISQAQASTTRASSAAAAAKVAIAHAQTIAPDIPDLREALSIAEDKIDELTLELLHVQDALTSATVRINALEQQVITQADQLNASLAHDAASTKKYHQLKFYFCLMAAAAAFLLLFQFRGLLLLLGPYGFIAYAAVPGAVFAALWFIL